MMTPTEHYAEAERLLTVARQLAERPYSSHEAVQRATTLTALATRAQAHATLALFLDPGRRS